MNITHLTKVRKLYNNTQVSRETNRFNQRAWVRSVRHLGSRWLLATPIRKETAIPYRV